MPESGFVLTPCSRACYPWCRCALSVERPCTGEFPEPPAAPVNGSFYACALVWLYYRGTLNLRGSGLPGVAGSPRFGPLLCSPTARPRCRYGLSLEGPRRRYGDGEFPEPPAAPVNGSFYACALVRYTYRGTLNLRGSGLPGVAGSPRFGPLLCSPTARPRCRYGLSLEGPRRRHGDGEFPEPPAAPVNGSFYACALVRYTYRGTLNLRGSGLPGVAGSPRFGPLLCSPTARPRCRYGLSLEGPRRRHGDGEFPEPPAAPVNGSFYACALVRYTYRGTLNLRGSGLPGVAGSPRLDPFSAALRRGPVVATDSPWRDPVGGTGTENFRSRRRPRSMGVFTRVRSFGILIGGP